MGDAISIALLVGYAAFILREYLAQCVEEKADRRSLQGFADFRREMEKP